MVSRSKFDMKAPSFKKQLMSLAIMIGLLVSAWYAYSVVSSLIWQSNKYGRQDNINDPNLQNTQLTPVYPTPPGFNIDFSNFDPSLLQQLLNNPELLESLMDFLSGNPNLLNQLLENMDPAMMDQLLNMPVFYVYPDPGSSVDNFDIWRTTGYNYYSGVGSKWSQSNSATTSLTLIDNRFDSQFIESYEIKFPFGTTEGTNAIIPTCNDAPYIDNDHGNFHPNVQSLTLTQDMGEGVKATFTLDPSTNGNLTYGLAKKEGPSDAVLNAYSDYPWFVPYNIQQTYLQIPGGKASYRAANPNFNFHCNQIAGNISMAGANTVYEIADLIREYLAQNFDLDLDTSDGFDRPSDSEDQVEWFLARKSGLPMDFASAYVMFLRQFDIPCRYVSGYNSLLGDDYGSYYAVTLGCMYAWVDVYIPSLSYPDLTSDFYQMPIMFNGVLGGLLIDPELIGQQGTINVQFNNTYSSFAAGTRGMQYQIRCGLNLTGSESNASRTIEMIDNTDDTLLGTGITDSNGYVEFNLKLNSNFTVGAHPIIFRYTTYVQNMTVVLLIDEMQVYLISVDPQNVDLNPTLTLNRTTVNARILDPENNKPVKNAMLQPVVINSGGAAISGSVVPTRVRVDNYGYINTEVQIANVMPVGSYRFRVDFNGTYEFKNPYTNEWVQYTAPPPYGSAIGYSSNVISPFDIINTDDIVFDFRVNSTIAGNDFYAKRGNTLNVNAYLSYMGSPEAGQQIDIIDGTYGDYLIGTIYTSGGGFASNTYTLSGYPWVAGPHRIYARWVNRDRVNGSWYVVINETVSVSSSLNPTAINRKGASPTTFSISGSLTDLGLGMTTRYAQIYTTMYYGAIDRTNLLSPYPPTTLTDNSGSYNGVYDVDDTTPLGSYTVRAVFTGIWRVDGREFTLSNLASPGSGHTLIINDPSDIGLEFTVQGSPALSEYISTNPANLTREDNLNLQVRVRQGMSYLSGVSVTFRDETTGSIIATKTTDGSGYASTSNSTKNVVFAQGLNRISVEYSGMKNYSQVYIYEVSAFLNCSLSSNPNGQEFIRGTDLVTISGFIRDRFSNNIKNARVYCVVETMANIDVTSQISDWVSTGGSSQYTASLNGQFTFQFRFSTEMRGQYKIHIEFRGEYYDNNAQCPADTDDSSISKNSSIATVSCYASINFDAYYNPNQVLIGDSINVFSSNVLFDNGTAVTGVNVNCTFLTDTYQLCTSTSWALASVTSGSFNRAITITWGGSSYIQVVFAKDTVNYIAARSKLATYQP